MKNEIKELEELNKESKALYKLMGKWVKMGNVRYLHIQSFFTQFKRQTIPDKPISRFGNYRRMEILKQKE